MSIDFFLSDYASEATTYASETTTHASEANTHASEVTPYTSEATTHASEATTHASEESGWPPSWGGILKEEEKTLRVEGCRLPTVLEKIIHLIKNKYFFYRESYFNLWIHKFFWTIKEESRIFGNIVLLTQQNLFYDTSKKPAQFKWND